MCVCVFLCNYVLFCVTTTTIQKQIFRQYKNIPCVIFTSHLYTFLTTSYPVATTNVFPSSIIFHFENVL